MKKVILKKIDVRCFVGSAKLSGAEQRINEYIIEEKLDVISVSLFKEDDDTYIFSLTLR